MVIFHSYVSLPEGNQLMARKTPSFNSFNSFVPSDHELLLTDDRPLGAAVLSLWGKCYPM
jgi:hypothetical protein